MLIISRRIRTSVSSWVYDRPSLGHFFWSLQGSSSFCSAARHRVPVVVKMMNRQWFFVVYPRGPVLSTSTCLRVPRNIVLYLKSNVISGQTGSGMIIDEYLWIHRRYAFFVMNFFVGNFMSLKKDIYEKFSVSHRFDDIHCLVPEVKHNFRLNRKENGYSWISLNPREIRLFCVDLFCRKFC